MYFEDLLFSYHTVAVTLLHTNTECGISKVPTCAVIILAEMAWQILLLWLKIKHKLENVHVYNLVACVAIYE